MAASRGGHAFGAGAPSAGVLARGRQVAAVVAAYTAVAVGAVAACVALGHNPLTCDGWLGATGAASWSVSTAAGLAMGLATVSATRVMVRRVLWARALHFALRPAVHRAGGGALLALAAASATGEELLFRGLLVPIVGVVASSVAFGALHQVRGPARWPWMAWATVMGLLFALLFVATGSLAGPLAAHATINYVNLRFLRDNDPTARPRALGGLLRR